MYKSQEKLYFCIFGLFGCWLVGSSRTDNSSPGFPGKEMSLLLAAGTGGTSAPQQKELFCLFSWEVAVQRFKPGSVDPDVDMEVFG